MIVGEITDTVERFSYKVKHNFSENKFLITTRDYRYEYNIIPIVLLDNDKLVDLDEYEFENNLYACRPPFVNPKNIEDLPINRFYLNEIVKINTGNLVQNVGAESPFLPKVKTYSAYFHSVENNQIIEFFEGILNEEKSIFTPTSIDLFELIKNVYVETDNCFFVISNKQLIGPFIAQKVNENSLEIKKSSWRKFGEYILNDNSFLEFTANDLRRRIYIPNCKDLNLIFKNEFDFVSDDELLKQFEIELKNHPEYFDENSLDNFKRIISKFDGGNSFNNVIKKNDRLEKLILQSEKILVKNIDLVNLIPELKTIKEEKKQIEENIFIKKQELDEINLKKKELQDEIISLEERIKAELENKKDKYNKEIEQLESRKNNLEKEVQVSKEQLENNLHVIKDEIHKQRIIQDDLKAGVQKLKSEFTSEQKNAQEKLAELVKGKTHFDFISGRDLSEQENEIFDFHFLKVEDNYKQNQYREFRNEVVNILRQNNRIFETHFVDNLLISIFQNTLTIFAGVPGTGKTTLARILSNILAPKEKIREVSVNRGWTSQKDFIGFVNPLTKRFHSSSTDIYSLTKQMNEESKDEEVYLNTPMSFIILDEANLSPLEHYWSSFYNLTDSTGMLEVKLGHNETIKFPNNLRFIGTINFDHTTEELSPRVLDRINIIQLNNQEDISFSNISNSKLKNIKLSFKRCIDFFELAENNQIEFKIDDKTEKGYREIKNEFKNLKIFISPRVEIAIKRYITLASKYMSDVNKPLDYCVAQRLLPLINLHGSENKQKLLLLKEKLENNKCEISTRILEDIINIGSEKGIYEENFNYFLTLSNV